MAKYIILPIVEGHGEVVALPILLRRWLQFRRYHNFEVDVVGPVRAAGQGAIKVPHDRKSELGIEHYLEVALLRRPDAILVLLDADDDCPKALAPRLLARARMMVPADYPIGIVIANREYEAWFLAAFASPGFRRSLEKEGFRLRQRSLPRGMQIESVADCKKRIAALIDFEEGKPNGSPPAKYHETTHQPVLTKLLPFTPGMQRRSRSYRKLLKELHTLLMQARRRRSSSAQRPSS